MNWRIPDKCIPYWIMFLGILFLLLLLVGPIATLFYFGGRGSIL